MWKRTHLFAAAVLAGALIHTMPLRAQEPAPAGPPPEPEEQAQAPEPPAANPSPQRPTGGWRKFGEPGRPMNYGAPPPAYGGAPDQLVVPAGTWITIRVLEPLSSDHNAPGQTFSATLAQPLVVNGYVVARRGQMVEGRVTDAVKAGRAKGTSRLGLELTEIGLVDGQQMPIRSQLVEFTGSTSKGRDATAIGASTGVGAAIGAAADGGFGAGMGALAGAAASTIGVLVTRGRPTEVYPETPITFRTLQPVAIDTSRSAQVFRPATQQDYASNRQLQQRVVKPAPQVVVAPWYGGWGWGGYPYYPGSYWGPGLGFYYGGGWGGWGGWGRGWGRGRWR